MTIPIVIAGAVVLGVVVIALRIRRHLKVWAVDMADVGFSYVHVVTSPAGPTSQEIVVTLRGSTRPHPLNHLRVDPAEAAQARLELPEGFVRADSPDGVSGETWIPQPPMTLEPDVSRRFVLRFAPEAMAPVSVSVQLQTPMRAGGGISSFAMRAPLRDPRALEAANLRAALTSRARELGVVPNTLPEWPTLMAMERESRGESGD